MDSESGPWWSCNGYVGNQSRSRSSFIQESIFPSSDAFCVQDWAHYGTLKRNTLHLSYFSVYDISKWSSLKYILAMNKLPCLAGSSPQRSQDFRLLNAPPALFRSLHYPTLPTIYQEDPISFGNESRSLPKISMP